MEIHEWAGLSEIKDTVRRLFDSFLHSQQRELEASFLTETTFHQEIREYIYFSVP
jgi:hypothetical protein